MTAGTEPGRVIGGRYRLVEVIGAGGFGRVWKAHDEVLGLDVAVKELWLPPGASAEQQADLLARAAREARNAARLRERPNIAGVHDVITENELPWIVMQLVDGSSLKEHLGRHGPLPPADAHRAAVALLNALDAAHRAGIVHRDVKPANVMLAKDGEFVLTDFGIAVHNDDTALTTTGAFIGSLEYLAPERAHGHSLPAGDLFSLGVTLYEAVEGRSPFARGTAAGVLTALLHDPLPPMHRASMPLATLISGLTAKEPARRPTIEQALALVAAEPPGGPARPMPPTAVQPVLAAPAEPVHQPGSGDWSPPRRSRGPQLAILLAGLAVIAAVVTLVLVRTNQQDSPRADDGRGADVSTAPSSPSEAGSAQPRSDEPRSDEPGSDEPASDEPPSDEQARRALADQARNDLSAAKEMVGSWVPQVWSKRVGMTVDGTHYRHPEILAEYRELHEATGGNVLLLHTSDFPGVFAGPDFWVVIGGSSFPTAAAAQAWCDETPSIPSDCLPKHLVPAPS